MGRGPAQPTPFPSSFGAPGKTDGSLKRWEASSATWRKSGMRVLLLAVTAAVVGTLMLEHMRLGALSMPQQLLQPAQQPHGYAAADEPMTTAQAPHVDLHQQQQQVVASSRVDPTLAQQMHSLPVGSLGAAHGDQLEMLPRNRLLLATHTRLMWYFPDSHEFQVLHEGEGVHYGMFPGAGASPGSVWTAIRPHNWRPTTTKEWLVELDMVTGQELSRVAIPSRFTHDVARTGDDVFVCDTGNGRILQLSFPDMTPIRSMDLFDLKDHPNTLAPLEPDNFLVVLHNLGSSDIVRVNVSASPMIPEPSLWLAQESLRLEQPAQPQLAHQQQVPEGDDKPILGRVKRVGEKAHGLVPWQGAYIMLDSDNGALIALDLSSVATGAGFKVVRLWKAPEEGMFLKGLAIVDDIAYFGISPWAPRSARDDPRSNNQLAAFDLVNQRLLWRREIPTGGLLNTVGAPHLSEASTYLPSYTGEEEVDSVRKHHTSMEVAMALKSYQEIGYPPKVGGYWSSGLPFLDASYKATRRPWEAGLQLPLIMLNITDLQAAVAALPEEAWTYEYQAKHSAVMAGREGNQNAFKPGVEGIVLLFSANDGSGPVYKFPAYDYFAPVLEPLLEEILGKKDMQHIIRLQLALMKPGVSDIKIHVDSGGYAIRGHRLHVPVFTHPEVSFDVCPHRYELDPTHVPGPGEAQRILDIQECFKIPTVEGFAFELNNRAAHKVSNLSPVSRVHLVFDLCEEPHPRVNVPPGTTCDYDMEQGLLCKYPDGVTPVVMPPAQWIDATAAAVESQSSSTVDQAAVGTAQDDNGTGYFTADDALGAHTSADSSAFLVDVSAPLPQEVQMQVAPAPHHSGADGLHLSSGMTLPDAAAETDAAHVFGTVGNGQASTWVTAAMHPQSALQLV